MDKDEALLDNPIWNSLATTHAHLASGDGLARRYPYEIGPLSGLREPTPAAYADLATIIPEDDVAVLFLKAEPALPASWQLLFGEPMVQMICRIEPTDAPLAAITPLTIDDYPEMLALATLTEPGPFRTNTGSLGGFLGIRVDGRLVAMAGRRLAPTGFVEVSAVCTHSDFRGRGYARALVTAVARGIQADDSTPILTALASNTGALRVYERIGFALRRTFHLAVLKPPAK